MSKAKRTQGSQYILLVRSIKWGFIILGLGSCGLGSCIAAFLAYMSVGLIQPSLDAALLPTAQYLVEHPQPTPEGMTITLRYETSSLRPKVCYSYTQELDVYESFWTTLYVNGAMVPRIETLFLCHSDLLTRENFYQSSIDAAKLDKGLHLVELHLRRWPWDEPYIYQGAVMVGE